MQCFSEKIALFFVLFLVLSSGYFHEHISKPKKVISQKSFFSNLLLDSIFTKNWFLQYFDRNCTHEIHAMKRCKNGDVKYIDFTVTNLI